MNIRKVVQEIQAGNLVITPTDTVYGILADATNSDAIKKVYDCKNRDKCKAFILIMDSVTMLQDYTQNISSLEKEIIEKYLPGKLTILLQKNSKVSDEITGGSKLVGIRIPDNKDLLEIIKLVGKPLISTSANISGKSTITNPKEIEPELLEHISYVEDEGDIISEPSSLIKIVDKKIEVLREGSIARKILEDYRNK